MPVHLRVRSCLGVELNNPSLLFQREKHIEGRSDTTVVSTTEARVMSTPGASEIVPAGASGGGDAAPKPKGKPPKGPGGGRGRGRGRGRGGAPGKEKVRTDLTSPPRMNPPAFSSSPLTIHYSSRRRVKEPRRKPRSPRRRNRRRARNDSSGKEVWPKIVILPKTLPHSTFLTHLACRRPLSSFILALLQPLALTSFDPPHLNQQ